MEAAYMENASGMTFLNRRFGGALGLSYSFFYQ